MFNKSVIVLLELLLMVIQTQEILVVLPLCCLEAIISELPEPHSCVSINLAPTSFFIPISQDSSSTPIPVALNYGSVSNEPLSPEPHLRSLPSLLQISAHSSRPVIIVIWHAPHGSCSRVPSLPCTPVRWVTALRSPSPAHSSLWHGGRRQVIFSHNWFAGLERYQLALWAKGKWHTGP